MNRQDYLRIALAITYIFIIAEIGNGSDAGILIRGNHFPVEIPSSSDPTSRKAAAESFWMKVIHEVVDNAISREGIDVPPEQIQHRARELASARLDQLGEKSQRQEMYERVRQLSTEVSKALSLFKVDPVAGDAYAKAHLEPLGVSPSYWEWFKQHQDDPSVIKSVEAGKEYGDNSILHEAQAQAKRELARTALEEKVASHHEIPPAAARRLSVLLTHRHQLRLHVWAGTIYDSGFLQAEHVSPERLLSRLNEQRLLGPWNGNEPPPDWVIRMMAEVACGLKTSDKKVHTRPIFILEGGSLLVRQYEVMGVNLDDPVDAEELTPREKVILEDTWRATIFGEWLLNALRDEVKVNQEHQWLLGPS